MVYWVIIWVGDVVKVCFLDIFVDYVMGFNFCVFECFVGCIDIRI